MKCLINNSLIKKILISLLLVVMMGNFILPNRVQAISGGTLAQPIFDFIAWIGDSVLEFLQKTIGNGGDIQDADGNFLIQYTIGNIFANSIASFDVNFVSPNKYTLKTGGIWMKPSSDDPTKYGLKKDYGYFRYDLDKRVKNDVKEDGNTKIITSTYEWENDGKVYIYETVVEEWVSGSGNHSTETLKSANLKYMDKEKETEVTSTAKELQPTISKWYKGLRTFALVGLLSVLVYIGIRIIISSSAGDKSKYKSMFMNWIAAICILFVLHYIMVFVLSISEQITAILKENVQGDIGQDVALNYVRSTMEGNDKLLQVAGETICYVVIVIYTVVFTIQYLKRVVYMAFLTLIAPLIALTYPLDKLKDGKAQAFSMWLKEYIFNALLQPIHLLLYVILVGSVGVDFIETNVIYSIVAVGFLIPAEKFFRKMFGMESQTSVGTIGAAAGGAMVMSALNKLKGKSPKEQAESKPKVRTASNGAGESNQQAPTNTAPSNTAPSNTRTSNSGAQNSGTLNSQNTSNETSNLVNTNHGMSSSVDRNNIRANSGETNNQIENPESSKVKPVSGQRFKRGALAVKSGILSAHGLGKKYVYGANSTARRNRGYIRKTITGAAGGLFGATVGLAAGVATGDLGKAFQFAGAGAAAGYMGAKNLGDNISSKVQGVNDKIIKSSMGTEAYNNAKFDEQFFKSDEYKILQEKYGKGVKEQAQGFLEQGVTDASKMGKLIEKGVTPEVYRNYASANVKDPDVIKKLQTAGANGNPITPEDYTKYANAGVRDVDKMSDLAKAGIDASEYEQFENAGISNVNKIKELKQFGNAERISMMSKIAKNFPKDILMDDNAIDKFKNFAKNFGASDEDAEELFNNLQKFV